MTRNGDPSTALSYGLGTLQSNPVTPDGTPPPACPFHPSYRPGTTAATRKPQCRLAHGMSPAAGGMRRPGVFGNPYWAERAVPRGQARCAATRTLCPRPGLRGSRLRGWRGRAPPDSGKRSRAVAADGYDLLRGKCPRPAVGGPAQLGAVGSFTLTE